MNKVNYLLIILVLLVIIVIYLKKTPSGEGPGPQEAEKMVKSEEITISPLKTIELYEDAILEMNQPDEYENLPAGNINFSYEVINFKLGEKSKIPDINKLATYSSGNHLTLILNNKIRKATIDPEFEYNLNAGQYVILSILTGMNYVSVKSPDSFIIRQFSVGSQPKKEIDLTGPNLFYHMPSGAFSGTETKNVLLDFYLVNCKLSPNDFQIRATINGRTFMIRDWTPYLIHGLPYGETTVTLELLDKSGNPVVSQFHKVTQKVFLYEREPV